MEGVKKLLPWTEKYRPSKIEDILYHEKITNSVVKYIENNKLPHLLFYGPPGTGKCLGYNTNCLLYNGKFKYVQDIRIGDLLMGTGSEARTVLNIVRGKDMMYKIVQMGNGKSYVVNSYHILCLKLVHPYFKYYDNDKKLWILVWFEKFEEHYHEIHNMNVDKYIMNFLSKKTINKKNDKINIELNIYFEKSPLWKLSFHGYKSNVVQWINKPSTKHIDYIKQLLKNDSNDVLKLMYFLGLEQPTFDKNICHLSNVIKTLNVKNRTAFLEGVFKSTLWIRTKQYSLYKINRTNLNKYWYESIEFIANSLGIPVQTTNTSLFIYVMNDVGTVEQVLTMDQIIDDNPITTSKISVEKLNYDDYYGFELDGNKQFLLYDFTVTHNTSTIITIAKHYYKDEFDDMIMILNASEARGIDTVRTDIKDFAKNKPIPVDKSVPSFKLIILDEIDAMTDDAQATLRKVIEKYVLTVRFCFICNYLKKINPAIQSRCVIFRFSPLTQINLQDYVVNICMKERIYITKNALNLIISKSSGDLRKILNIMQSLYMSNNMEKSIDKDIVGEPVITERLVGNILTCPTKKNIMNILLWVKTKNISEAFTLVDKMIQKYNLSIVELVNEAYSILADVILNKDTNYFDAEKLVNIVKNLAIVDDNLSYSSNEQVQLCSFISCFYL